MKPRFLILSNLGWVSTTIHFNVLNSTIWKTKIFCCFNYQSISCFIPNFQISSRVLECVTVWELVLTSLWMIIRLLSAVLVPLQIWPLTSFLPKILALATYSLTKNGSSICHKMLRILSVTTIFYQDRLSFHLAAKVTMGDVLLTARTLGVPTIVVKTLQVALKQDRWRSLFTPILHQEEQTGVPVWSYKTLLASWLGHFHLYVVDIRCGWRKKVWT